MYVKLFSQILRSSVMELSVETRWAWICILAAADEEGYVYGTPQALARMANLPVKAMESALVELSEPDPSSSSQNEEGRRLIQVGPNVWQIVNYLHYRRLQDKEAQRAEWRERQRRARTMSKLQKAGGSHGTSEDDTSKPEIVLEFPTVGKVQSWPLTSDFVADLEQAFPSIDVLAEAKRALTWVKSAAGNRKTARGMRRFLFSWMARVADSGRGSKRQNGTASASIDWESLFESDQKKSPPPGGSSGGGGAESKEAP